MEKLSYCCNVPKRICWNYYTGCAGIKCLCPFLCGNCQNSFIAKDEDKEKFCECEKCPKCNKIIK